jgi:CheY-like chemotaxis protein
MTAVLSRLPDAFRILVVDDEPDVLAVTRLSLKGLKHGGRPVELVGAATGKQAIDILRGASDIAVVLLDVVMETDTAGLDACRAIREQIGNRTVRILLRTGQPGQAPEKQTIDAYDLDGYLPKAELTSTRLYSSVRAALKAWEELVQLERYRRYLSLIHERTMALRSYDPLPAQLTKMLEAALEICPARLAVLNLETFEREGNPQRHLLHLSAGIEASEAKAAAEDVRSRISRDPQARSSGEPRDYDGGVLVPLAAHRDLGRGWMYLAGAAADELARTSLAVLAGHAANALYSTVVERMLAGSEDRVDSLAI